MPCGKDGKGYSIEVPTPLVQKAAPVLKAGFLLLKLALATQGLGSVVPNVGEFLPSSCNLDVLNGLLSEVGSMVTDKPKMIGLVLCTHAVTGDRAWVSPTGKAKFKALGKTAFSQVTASK